MIEWKFMCVLHFFLACALVITICAELESAEESTEKYFTLYLDGDGIDDNYDEDDDDEENNVENIALEVNATTTKIVQEKLDETKVDRKQTERLASFTDKTYHHPSFFNDVLNPHHLLKPISDKISLLSNYLTYPHHPNYGGATWLNADHIWQKFNHKHQHFVPNTNKAVFGVALHHNYDYPFPYRSLKKARSVDNNDDETGEGKQGRDLNLTPRSYIFFESKEGDKKNIYFFPYYARKNDWQQILGNATAAEKLSTID